MKTTALERILIVGDSYGVPELLTHIPVAQVVGIVCAAVRPQHHAALMQIAKFAGLPLLIQPLKSAQDYPDFVAAIARLQPDSMLCHSYSMLIREDVLTLVSGRAINIHSALLPRHRGPNPVQWALIHGDQETGVTMHVMDKGFDSGGILFQEKIVIEANDTWVTLSKKLRESTQALLASAMPTVLSGEWHICPQNESHALSNSRICPDSLEIKFNNMSDLQIFNLIRAQVAPLKGAYLRGLNETLRIPNLLTMAQISELRKIYESTHTS